MKSRLDIRNEGQAFTLDIFGEIGWSFWAETVTADSVRAALAGAKGGSLTVTIDSPGGSVADAIAIYNIIRETGATVTTRVQGIAASAAAYLAMAADPGKIEMPANTLMMIHKPWLYTAGNSDDLRKDADALDKFQAALDTGFSRHWKGTPEELQAAIAAETWYTAAEAADRFGAVVIGEPFQAAAMLDLSGLGELPEGALAFGCIHQEPAPENPGMVSFTEADLVRRDEEITAAACKAMDAEVANWRDKATAATARIAELEAAARAAAESAAAKIAALEDTIKVHESAVAKANADAEAARDLVTRISGRRQFGGDSEAVGTMSWSGALAKCGGDYVMARKTYPDAYEAYRRDCRTKG